MNRLTRFLLRLYPRWWRERYGAEFAPLVEDTGGGWLHLFDILSAALKMRLSSIHWRYVGVFALAGTAIAAVIAVRIPDRYMSGAVLRTEPGSAEQAGVIATALLSRTSLAKIIANPDLQLYKEDRSHKPLEDVVDSMRNTDVRIVFMPSGFVRISYLGANPTQAQHVVQLLVARYMEQHRLLQSAHEPALATGTVEVADPPSLPQGRLLPNRPMVVTAGLLGGLVLALLTSLIRRAAKVWFVASLVSLGLSVLALVSPLPYEESATVRFDSKATLDRVAAGVPRDVYLSSARRPDTVRIRARNADRRLAQKAVLDVVQQFTGAGGEPVPDNGFIDYVLGPPNLPERRIGAQFLERLSGGALIMTLLSGFILAATGKRRLGVA